MRSWTRTGRAPLPHNSKLVLLGVIGNLRGPIRVKLAKHLVRSYSFAALSKTRPAAMSVDLHVGEGSSARELPFCILHPGRF